MTTLDRLDVASDTVRARDTAEIRDLLQRAETRPVLACVWTVDASTGRPVCSWMAKARS